MALIFSHFLFSVSPFRPICKKSAPSLHSTKGSSPLALFSQSPNPQTTLQAPTLDPTRLLVVGPSRLSGHIHISGSKNSALPVLAGTLCCSTGTSILRGIPNLSDTATMVSILRSLGACVHISHGEMLVDASGIWSVEPCSHLVGKIRASFFVLGPLLARFGEATVALPGGCDIGARPIDLYIRGLQALGAIIELRWGKVYACAANGRGLVGGRFHLDYPSVGATETLMMAASMADGLTVLTNVAQMN